MVPPPPTCPFSIPAKLLSCASAVKFEGSLGSHSPWFLWSEEYDTVDHLPLLLKHFISLSYHNTLFFFSVSNIYSSSTLPLNLGAPEKFIDYSLQTYTESTCHSIKTFHSPATLLLLFYCSPTLREPRCWAKQSTCQCMRNTHLQTTFEKNMTKVLKSELF